MAKRNKFPRIINITRDVDRSGEGPFGCLLAWEDGLMSQHDDGEPIAVYKRIAVGKVHLTKAFVRSKE